jgi:hypothetical protein
MDNDTNERKEITDLYRSYTPLRCPALGDFVHFTSEGFNHLVYKGKKERDPRVRSMKFKLLPKARYLLGLSTTFQEYEETYQSVTLKKRGSRVTESKIVKYWGFVALIDRTRLKTVVRQIGEGKKEFYSVIPAWFARQYRDITFISTSTGNGLLSDEDSEALKNATGEVGVL